MTTTDATERGFTEAEWAAARPWAAYLDSVTEKRAVWLANARRATLDDDARARLAHLPGARRVLVLTEDWCGDAARSIPGLAAALETTEQVQARYLDSDAHPAPLERFLTHGGRAIPIVIVTEASGRLLGVWGPRPAPLQALVRARMREIGPATPEGLASWYAPILGWYGKDAGRTTLEEVLMVLERGGEMRP